MCRSIDLESLPATIRDTIVLSRVMGFRYLWVDTLCIIQPDRPGDPNDQRDWANELPNMHRYYKNAIVTLVIESAAGDDEGFLQYLERMSKKRVPAPIPIYVRTKIDDSVFHFDYDYKTFSDFDSFFDETTPLRKRGWTLQ